ncbi:hypothetical protein, partial [Methanomethylophilus alvi]|uniref:hypothetical protein n=1 Tax=Methanomethylophilus alvi TaxID=1291540 RepID=UPI0037DD020B
PRSRVIAGSSDWNPSSCWGCEGRFGACGSGGYAKVRIIHGMVPNPRYQEESYPPSSEIVKEMRRLAEELSEELKKLEEMLQ